MLSEDVDLSEHINLSIQQKRKALSEDARWFLRKRYYLIFMLSCGMTMNVLLQTNLSIAIIEMTSNKNITNGNVTYTREAEFKWSSIDKGLVLSSFSWGYLFSPVGGLLSAKYGGVKVFGVGILITGFLTFLTPVLVRLNIIVFIIGRVIEGMAEGSAISGGIVQIFVNWIPFNERSRAIGVKGSGYYVGVTVAYPICGFAAYLYGWEMMFVLTGGVTIIWCIIWFIFFETDPSTDRFISKAERTYVSKNVVAPLTTKIEYPWKRIFTSTAVWAYFNECLIYSWLRSLTTFFIPLYIKDVHDVTIDNVGLISSIPNFTSFLGIIVGSISLDYIRNKKLLSNCNSNKLICIGTNVICVAILTIMIIRTDFWCIIFCLSFFTFWSSFSDPCIMVMPLDLSPHHASLLTSIASIFKSIGYAINPIIVGLIVRNHTAAEWNTYFATLFGIVVWSIFIFFIYGSAKLQPWAM